MKNEIDGIKKNKRKKTTVEKNLLTWFKFIVGILFSGLIFYKLAISEFTFDFSQFDFNALLTLILTIFAIGLSVAFYFKATDTSNLFYDNTYKFTKEISEILGRIEAGFGERLRNLDKGYSGLINKFDNVHTEQNREETQDEIEKEKAKLKKEIKERGEILDSLFEKSRLDKHEKESIRKQLKEKDIVILKQNREINFLKQRLDYERESSNSPKLSLSENNPLTKLARRINDPESFLEMTTSQIARRYKFNICELSNNERAQLHQMNIINENGDFTIHGIRILKQIVSRVSKS